MDHCHILSVFRLSNLLHYQISKIKHYRLHLHLYLPRPCRGTLRLRALLFLTNSCFEFVLPKPSESFTPAAYCDRG
ncbi:hypothetical protein EBX31_14425, partial [bacterium]|nr:hypothetical protein [bacterium]